MSNVTKYEKYFKNEKELDKVLKTCEPYFSKIESYHAKMRNYKDSLTILNQIMIRLQGIRGYLEPILAEAISSKLNKEVIYYNKLKAEVENNNQKFVNAVAEKEASAKVANYRRIRNILQAYVELCKSAISAIQTTLRRAGSTNEEV